MEITKVEPLSTFKATLKDYFILNNFIILLNVLVKVATV